MENNINIDYNFIISYKTIVKMELIKIIIQHTNSICSSTVLDGASLKKP